MTSITIVVKSLFTKMMDSVKRKKKERHFQHEKVKAN